MPFATKEERKAYSQRPEVLERNRKKKAEKYAAMSQEEKDAYNAKRKTPEARARINEKRREWMDRDGNRERLAEYQKAYWDSEEGKEARKIAEAKRGKGTEQGEKRKEQRRLKYQDPDYKEKQRLARIERQKNETPEQKEKRLAKANARARKNYVPKPRILKTEEEKKATQKASSQAWNRNNRDYIAAKAREYRATNPIRAISERIRARIRDALKYRGIEKKHSSETYMGCTPDELAAHLEAQFTEGMCWENRNLWAIDHWAPLSLFDLHNEEELMLACHVSNLQPLWNEENGKKNNKFLVDGEHITDKEVMLKMANERRNRYVGVR